MNKYEIRQAILDLRAGRDQWEATYSGAISDGLSAIEENREREEILLMLAEEVLEREMVADAIAARMKDLQERKSRIEASAEGLRTAICQAMDMHGPRKLQGVGVTLSLGDKKASVVITNEAEIPSRFWKKPEPVLDKAALNEAVIGDGEVIPGCERGNGGVTLTMRRK